VGGGSGPRAGCDCAGDPLDCAGEGSNDNETIATYFGSFFINDCEGVIDYVIANYGFTLESACAWDGSMGPGMPSMLPEGSTLGDVCGCSCPAPVAPTCAADELEVVLTATDSWGDGWNGNLANVYFDGVLFDPAGVGFTYTLVEGAEEVSSFCIPLSATAGCLLIEVGGGSFQSEVSWSISVFEGSVELVAGGAPFAGDLGCAVEGCMDETACDYDADATISGECIYPALNEDCEGNFDCDGIEFTLDMYDSWGDGWNGGTFAVVNWVTGDYEYGPVTLESGDSGSTLACFPQDMAWGCYIIEVGGGSFDDEISWHLYVFESASNISPPILDHSIDTPAE
jgi:hypothetical protein